MGLFDNNKETKFEEIKPIEEERIDNIYTDDSVSEIAFISASTKIDGNISTQGHLVLNGDIQGTTAVKGNLVLNGSVHGNVACDSLLAEEAEVVSDIKAENNIVIKQDTTIQGNINCKNITVYGKIHGDIVASSVVLKSTSVVEGNISAARVGMESGAKLIGAVKVR